MQDDVRQEAQAAQGARRVTAAQLAFEFSAVREPARSDDTPARRVCARCNVVLAWFEGQPYNRGWRPHYSDWCLECIGADYSERREAAKEAKP